MRRPVRWLMSMLMLLSVSCSDDDAGDAAGTTASTSPSGPREVPAACTTDSYIDALRSEVEPGLRIGDAECAGDRLVVEFTIEDEVKRGFFDKEGDRWEIVTYIDPVPCDELPDEVASFRPLCEPLAARRR